MHLQGKEIVSEATRRAARQLVATSLIVFLAKFYALDLTGLQVFEVSIDPTIVSGAANIVIAFQVATFLVHWGGDFISLDPWNRGDKVNGISRQSAASSVLLKLDAAIEHLELIHASLEHNIKPLKSDENPEILHCSKGFMSNCKRFRDRRLYGVFTRHSISMGFISLCLFWSP